MLRADSYQSCQFGQWLVAQRRTVCVKPGFVRRGMTGGLKAPPFAGEPEGVARAVLAAIDRGTPELYTPGIWAHVMRVIRWLPRFVMRKIKF